MVPNHQIKPSQAQNYPQESPCHHQMHHKSDVIMIRHYVTIEKGTQSPPKGQQVIIIIKPSLREEK